MADGTKDDQNHRAVPLARPDRRIRADAQRSIDALLEAAKIIFAAAGVDAPVRDIASEAGVGIGTVYRNFPKRSDLIAAVFRREIDACADAAAILAKEHPPFEALTLWVQRYLDFLGTKRGFSTALYSNDAAYEALPNYVRRRFGAALDILLASAASAGAVREDIQGQDLLRAVAGISTAADTIGVESTQRMVGVFLDGLRYGKKASGGPEVGNSV